MRTSRATPTVRTSPSTRRLTVGAASMAAALAVTALAPAPTPAHAAESGAVSGGHLDWGIKTSFRTYLTGPIAQGSATATGGATTNADGTYRFAATAGTHDHGAGTTTSVHAGGVHFTGHAGALDVTVSDLRVELQGTAGAIRADVSTRNQQSGQFDTYDDIAFATIDLAAATPTATATGWTWTALPTTLTATGATAFAGFYQAGAPMDPVTLTLAVGLQATTTTSSTSSTSSTTTSSSTSTTVAPSTTSTSTTVPSTTAPTSATSVAVSAAARPVTAAPAFTG